MKLLIVGGGGREHALAWKFVRDNPALDLIAAPGNPGIAELGRCVNVAASDVSGLVALARAERPDLTVVGPELPLAAGLVDALREARIPAFGPSAAAARVESSKRFAKEVMARAGVATARAVACTDPALARSAARRMGLPVVIKAAGLAAGKGVIVCATRAEADAAIDAMLLGHIHGSAGDEILVEEFMQGEELSLFVVTDGTNVLPMIPAQDHKRLLEGDAGPNTGGMGAYAPVTVGTPERVQDIVERVILPTLGALRAEGAPFTGLLYAGLMLTATGPRVVEFNCRFGDPETQALLPLLESDLVAPLLAVARGEPLGAEPLRWSARHAVTTVVAAAGYPDAPRTGAPITLPEPVPDVHIFHAGTRRLPDGTLVTAGGRVLSVTAVAASLADAQQASAAAARSVAFDGKQYRADIGWRELRRNARTA